MLTGEHIVNGTFLTRIGQRPEREPFMTRCCSMSASVAATPATTWQPFG